MRKNSLYAIGVLAFGVVAAGCGGGGGSAVPTTPGLHSGSGGSLTSSGSAKFVISFPSIASQSTGRVPKYVSPNTQSISITETDGGSAPLPAVVTNVSSCPSSGGITTCTMSVPANPGSDTFAVSTFDAQNAGGHTLSTGSLTATIVAGQANTTVPVVLGGVVNSLTLTLDDAFLPVGSSGTNLLIQAKDASGATIVGTFDNPVTASAGSGASLSQTTFTNSNDASKAVVSYTGEPSAPITISATGDGHGATTVLTPGSGIKYYSIGTNRLYNNGGFQVENGTDGKLYYSANGSCTVSPTQPLCSAGSGTIGQFDPVTHGFAEYDNPNSQINGVAQTPDGAIWALEKTTLKIARFAPGTFPAAPTEVAIPSNRTPRNFAYGPDGKLWYSSYNGVGKIDPAVAFTSAAITAYTVSPVPGHRTPYLQGIAWGADGNLYAADFNNGQVDQISTSGVVLNRFNIPNGIAGRFVAAAPDGNLYITEGTEGQTYPFVGGLFKMTTSGVFTTINLPASSYSYDPDFIAAGPASVAWGDLGNSSFGTLDSNGSLREIPADDYLTNQTTGHGVYGVAYAPDQSPWFICYGNAVAATLCMGHVVLNTTWSVFPGRSINIYGTGTQSGEYMGIAESGNSGPFTITSANPAIATATNPADHNFSIVGVSAGTTQLTLTDANARSVKINVTVTTTTGTVQSIHRTSGGSI